MTRNGTSTRYPFRRLLAVLGTGVAASFAAVVLSLGSTITQQPGIASHGATVWIVGSMSLLTLVIAGCLFFVRKPNLDEQASFQELRRACAQNDPLAVFAAHTRWLATLEIDLDASEFDALLAPFQEWEELQLATENGDTHWSADRLLQVLESQRACLVNPDRGRLQTERGEGPLLRA